MQSLFFMFISSKSMLPGGEQTTVEVYNKSMQWMLIVNCNCQTLTRNINYLPLVFPSVNLEGHFVRCYENNLLTAKMLVEGITGCVLLILTKVILLVNVLGSWDDHYCSTVS